MARIEADWLKDDRTQAVFAMLETAGFQSFVVGGCVRDSLLCVEVKDIDISTDAHPKRVMVLAEELGFHAVPTGIEHGTVTVVVGSLPHEITTFRKDVATDGRRATVAFADDIGEDARRRDFTMNALYADRSGKVHDPIHGLPDLFARRIRFIEDAETRIREDYLRSLRFFRFVAWYGDPNAGLDADAMAAIAANVDGLQTLSRERIGAEMLKLLAAPNPAPAVAAMRSTGALAVFLPGSDDRFLAPLVHLEQSINTSPDPLRRLAVIGGEDPAARLRLSRKQSEYLSAIAKATALSPGEAGYRFGQKAALDALLVSSASLGQAIDPSSISVAELGSKQTFPLKADDLMPEFQGEKLGRMLRKLEQDWLDSGFALDRDRLLELAAKKG